MSDIQMNLASSSVSSTPPLGSAEPMLFKLYVDEWAKNQKKTDDKMQSLEDINTKLNVLNSLLAKLGKLLTQVTASGDNNKLKEVLNKETGLLDEINKQIKEADLPEPPFKNTEDQSFEVDLRMQVLKDMGKRDWPAMKWWFNNRLNLQPKQLTDVTDDQWKALASEMFSAIPFGQPRLNEPRMPSELEAPKDSPLGSLGWVVRTGALLNQELVQRYNDAQFSRVPGALKNDSHAGKDVNAAVEIVKAQISNLSNRLQSTTSAVNQSMQVTTAIMSAITDITQKMFDAKSKALS